MSDKKRIHVNPSGDDWKAQREGARRASAIRPTQEGARKVAERIAEREGGEVIIHRRDGKIRDSDSYGNDPNPPKDKKH